ncbi:DUF5993 family protein [Streptomyces sp. T-3]|nr:DUF5993 family protein [Streptomyces sp. T-3]
MDTIIFGGLLATWFAIYQQRSRPIVLGAWAFMILLVAILLNHHITSSLKLGLSY